MRRILILLLLLCVASASATSVTLYNEINSSADLDTQNTVMSFMKTGSFIVINMLNQEPDPVEPGKYIDVRFKIENEGPDELEDVTFEILPKYPFTLAEGQNSQKFIGDLKGRLSGEEAIIIKYKLRVDDNAVEGPNEIKIRYESQEEPEEWSIVGGYYLNVRTDDSVLGIESVSKDSILPGKGGKLNIVLSNKGDTTLRHIVASLNFSSSDLGVLGTSNEMVIQTLNASSEKEITFEIIPSMDITQGVHSAILKLEYNDAYGETFTKNLQIGIPVFDEPAYILSLEDTTVYTAHKVGSVVLSLANSGTGNMKFASIKLIQTEDYEIISSPTIYLGNLESDDFETAAYDIYVNKKTESVQLVTELTFKDDKNNQITKKMEVPLNLYSAKELKNFELVEQKSKFGTIVFILIVLLAAWFFYRRWERKRR